MDGIDLKNVRLVCLHFTFSNPALLPGGVTERELETVGEWQGRMEKVRSSPLLGPAENTSLERVLVDLEEAGYELVDAWSQTRRHQNNSSVLYYVLQLTWAQQEYATPSDVFRVMRELILPQVEETHIATSLWTTEVFAAPFLRDGQPVPNQQVLRISLKGRKPLVDGTGNPILIWKKDGSGRRIGEAPVPLQPDSFLRIEQNGIRLVRSR